MDRNVRTARVSVSIGRVKSPLISDKPISNLPFVPTLSHTRELIEKSNKAIKRLKYKKEVAGVR